MIKCRIILALAALCITEAVSDVNYRLNTPIKPSSYDVSITPYFETGDSSAFTFDGEVNIKLFTENSTTQIKLHSVDLIYSSANITVSRGTTVINLNADSPLVFDEKYNFAYINLNTELQAGVEYNLRIVYRGPVRSDLQGFYRNYYLENGVKKWLGATQMEPTSARKVFPCFDEPGLKAIFTITIDRPESFQPSLSNMKIQTTVNLSNGYVRETFYPSPKMSTYLVAFLVSEYKAARYTIDQTKELGIYTRPDAVNQSDYAFDFGKRVVDALSSYFGYDYYSTDVNLKLDHVALPDFRAGAMENWGLVKYRESLLLYVPGVSTPYFKYRVAQIMAHETTHMWFGNLVTCHWWSNTWLNEGFANYFQDYITSLIEPEVGSADMLVIGSVYSAYDADDEPESVAITNNNVNSPAEISGHFGTITYQKAGSVIRMIHHLIGDEAFKFGLNSYVNTNQFDSGYPELIYSALDSGASFSNALADYPGSSVASVMNSWVSQPGHPLLKVDIDMEDGTVTLKQERFYIDSDYESDQLYKIPITYTTGANINFDNTKPAFIMEDKTHTLKISNYSHTWVIFNIQETGLYRVNYDEDSWKHIIEALKGDDRLKIHNLNRAKIVNDLFALYYSDEVDFDLVWDALGFLSEETDYAVIFAALRGLSKIRDSFLGTDALEAIEDSQINILDKIINNLDVNDTEDTVAQKNRMQVQEYACQIGHQHCVDNSVKLFRQLRENGTEITPSLRPAAYCTGLRYGDGEDYEFLWNRMVTTNIANEAWVIGYALGCTKHEDKRKKYLESILQENTPIRTQDLTVPLTSILTDYNNLGFVLDELQKKINEWTQIYPSIDTVLSTIASRLRTDDEFEEFEKWLSSCSQCTETAQETAWKAYNQAKATAGWAKGHKAEILKVLRSGSIVQTPILTLIVLGLLATWF